MKWSEFLKSELDSTYSLTKKMMDLADGLDLNWKPSSENNWMTNGQLLMHLTNACGASFQGFVTGDWGFPAKYKAEKLPAQEMLPAAETLPSVKSITEAKELIEKDYNTAVEMLGRCSDEKLENEYVTAPWSPQKAPLGLYLFQMIEHLKQHRAQLFYYLKLQGKPVNTSNLWSA